jgi:hypothetical protein
VSGGIRWTGATPADVKAAMDRCADDVTDAVGGVVRGVPDELRRTFPDAARAKMPRRGGLAALVASSDIEVDPGGTDDRPQVVATVAGRGISLGPLNDGDLRHPVYGHRKQRWARQRVPSGMWQDACDAAAEGADEELLQGLRDAARVAASST